LVALEKGEHMNTTKQQIKTALAHLGVKGTIRISPVGYRRYLVEVNGKYFGIFDIDQDTFVD
jgi:hypothetical protein